MRNLSYSSLANRGKEKTDVHKYISDSNTTKKYLVGSRKDMSPAALDITLFSDGTARSDNMATLLYKQWYVEDDTLCLVAKRVGSKTWSIDTTGYYIAQLGENHMKLKDENKVLEYKRNIGSQNATKNSEEQTKTAKGRLVLGHEARSFQPCGSDEVFWISDKTTNLKQFYDELTIGADAYTPIYVEMIFKDKGKAKEEFPAEYKSVYEVVEVLRAEEVTDSNCK